MGEKYAYYRTRERLMKVGYVGEKIRHLLFVKEQSGDNLPTEGTDEVYRQICEYMDGNRKSFTFAFEAVGTEFQKQVWDALCRIPYGETRTYSQIAEMIKNPKAVRAVGAANGRNPLWVVIPCHRVIGADGSLTGYAGGLDLKRELLDLEVNESVSSVAESI